MKNAASKAKDWNSLIRKVKKIYQKGIHPIVIVFDHLKEQILLSWSILLENPQLSFRNWKCCTLDGILVRKLKKSWNNNTSPLFSCSYFSKYLDAMGNGTHVRCNNLFSKTLVYSDKLRTDISRNISSYP